MRKSIDVLYEDNHILIVNKSTGLLVQKDKEGLETTLEDLAKDYIKRKYNKPGDVFLGIPHRIDRPTSGIVILCRTSKALVRVNQMFQDKEIHKKYWAIVSKGNLPPEGHWVDYVRRSPHENKTWVRKSEVDKYKRAELKYKVITSADKYMLCEVELLTGRHHQIRAQFSSRKFPLKGDVKYGARRKNEDASIGLLAREVSFIHPVSKKKINVVAPAPDDNLWKALTPHQVTQMKETLKIPIHLKPEPNSTTIYSKGILEYCIINKDGKIYAIDNICPHQDASIGSGEIKGDEILCPLHEFRFNIKTGKCHIEKYSVKSFDVEFE